MWKSDELKVHEMYFNVAEATCTHIQNLDSRYIPRWSSHHALPNYQQMTKNVGGALPSIDLTFPARVFAPYIQQMASTSKKATNIREMPLEYLSTRWKKYTPASVTNGIPSIKDTKQTTRTSSSFLLKYLWSWKWSLRKLLSFNSNLKNLYFMFFFP